MKCFINPLFTLVSTPPELFVLRGPECDASRIELYTDHNKPFYIDRYGHMYEFTGKGLPPTCEKRRGVFALIEANNHVLLTVPPWADDNYELPGGGIEDDDETKEHALMREIWEETGIRFQEEFIRLPLPAIHRKINFIGEAIDGGIVCYHYEQFFYHIDINKMVENYQLQAPEKTQEGSVAQWHKKDDLHELCLRFDHIPAIHPTLVK